MKKIILFTSIGTLLIVTIIFLTFCKKKEETITPHFIVTETKVQIQGADDGLQFTAKCTNDDVKMAKVLITDPTQSPPFLYNLNGTYYLKNETFALQAKDDAYKQQFGTWKFQFVGNRKADGSSFTINSSLKVAK